MRRDKDQITNTELCESIYSEIEFPDQQLDLEVFFALDYPPWEISYPKVKITTGPSEATFQKSPFFVAGDDSSLDIHYAVHPPEAWNSMKKYRNFVVLGETYTDKEYVWVRPVNKNPVDILNERHYWVCKIVEVRAMDESNVYALVFWLYRPDELPRVYETGSQAKSGRRAYHGREELIASNHMEVLDVLTFAGKAPVEQWMESSDEEEQRGLYWRQTFNHQTSKISDLTRHCGCRAYYNPDRLMIACSNESCKLWMHAECLVEKALRDVHKRLVADASNNSVLENNKLKRIKHQANKAYLGKLSAMIINQDGFSGVEITDQRLGTGEKGRVWREEIYCLKCLARLI